MALFNKKKQEEKQEKSVAAKTASKGAAKETKTEAVTLAPLSTRVILSARITEKATDLAMGNVYAFNVALNANKRQVIEAVKALYKVTPLRVRMVSIPRKVVSHPRSRKLGMSGLGKKAYVTLKKGDTISLK